MTRVQLFGVIAAGTVLGTAPAGVLAAPLSMAGQDVHHRERAPDEVVVRAARFLTDRQGAFATGSGEAIVLDGWEWLVGSGEGASNISGVVALGLLDAWEATGDEAFFRAAEARGDLTLRALRRGDDVYATDLELVARIGRASGRLEEQTLARKGFEAKLAKAGGAEAEVARIIGLRAANLALSGYDVALLAEAGLAVGDNAAAKALLKAVRERERTWLRGGVGSTFGLISQGALLSVSSRLGQVEASRGYAVSLLALQQDDGCWRARETQATAYATRGLSAFAVAFSDGAAAKSAARGRAWLQLTQLQNGAWADYNDYLPEPFVGDVYAPATAEALRALVSQR